MPPMFLVPPMQQLFLSARLPGAGRPVRVKSASGYESVSRLFEYQLEFDVSQLPATLRTPDAAKLLRGQDLTFSVQLAADGLRHWHGRIAQCVYDLVEKTVHLQVVPALSRLQRAVRSREFVNQDVQAIVSEILELHGITAVDWRLTETYEPYARKTQFRESDLNFVNRLLEHEGIVYWFEHTADSHTLVFGDSPASWTTCPLEVISVRRNDSSGMPAAEDTLDGWRVTDTEVATRWKLSGYSPAQPHADRCAESRCGDSETREADGISDFPTDDLRTDSAQRLSQVRLEAESCQAAVYSGEGNARQIAAGQVMTVVAGEWTEEVLPIAVDFHAACGSDFETQFFRMRITEAIPTTAMYRAPLVTTRPVIAGTHVAIVCGPDGKADSEVETHCDEQGRIQIRFPWDTRPADSASAWTPVSHPWTGDGYGMWYLPRVGSHVLVEFENGNPDFPIVKAGIYAGERGLPIDPVDDPSQFAIRTRSTPSGGGQDGSELVISDRAGEECFRLLAQKDLDTCVFADHRLYVGANRSEYIVGEYEMRCGQDAVHDYVSERTTSVGGNDMVDVTGTLTQRSKGDLSLVSSASTVIEGTSICLRAGGSTLVIDGSGIWLNGNLIGLNSSGPKGKKSLAKRRAAASRLARFEKMSKGRKASPKKGQS